AQPAASDDAVLFPSAQQAGDGVERRAGHFGDVLAREGDGDLNAVGGASASIVTQPEKRTRDALSDPLGRELHKLILRFLKAKADRLIGAGGERREALDDRRPR